MQLFTDYCLLCREINDEKDQRVLSDALLAIEDWYEAYKMKLTEEQTVAFRVTIKTKHIVVHNYIINSKKLSSVDSPEYLGMTMTQYLS